MSAERVDKAWHSRGIDTYSTAAILGTLGHYGVPLTEEAYLSAAAEDFPLTIAQAWHERWKGTGQFSRFPGAASEELWRRLKAGEIAPTDLALAVVNLLTTLDDALEGKQDDGTWDTRFKVAEAYLPKLPPPSDRREKFMAEVVGALGEWLDVLDRMGEALVKKQHPALADRFVALEEALFPVRAGTASALVKAAKGDVETAMQEVAAIAADGSRDEFSRICAIDALLDYARHADARRFILELMDRAEAHKDLELAVDAAQRLQRLLQADPGNADRADLLARLDRLERALADQG